ncbi:MAG: hypothetical protein H7839_02440 [Magnetococcus sp. YQC-5]
MKIIIIIALLLVQILAPAPVNAYIGPGAGISAFGSLLSLIAVLFLVVVGFFWYPIKKLLLRYKRTQKKDET